MTSRDGFHWTKGGQLQKGIPSIGVIEPSSKFVVSEESTFDVIVIGAGYCGLTAARDAAVSGLKVLVIEARDRIGGRSWSSNIDGYPFEMGGTWVYWGQGHVWRELSRYGMIEDLELSQDYSHGVNKFSMDTATGIKDFTHDEEDELVEIALKKFVNVDGAFGRRIMANPYESKYTPEANAYDKLSAADRIVEIADILTPNERTALESFILLCSGGTLKNMSFLEFLHWWALSGHTYEGCLNHLIKYKFKGGQSSFAIRFWEEAISTKRLSYTFNCPTARVADTGKLVEVTSRQGKTYRADRLICTIPLNVLNTIKFDPALLSTKSAAADIGHVNQCVKVHAEVKDKDLRSWSGMKSRDSELLYAIGDGTTPAGNTHIVAFGANEAHLQPEEDVDRTSKALQAMVPMQIERLVFHNWSRDEFAKGAWFFPTKNFISQYLKPLRAEQGLIHFANSDWALGWRSFIDGAIEEGTRAAAMVGKAIAASNPRS